MKAKDFFPNTDYVTFLKSDLERAFEKAYNAGYTEANISSGRMAEIIFVSEDIYDFGRENYVFSRSSESVMKCKEKIALNLYDFVSTLGLEVKEYTFKQILGESLADDFINDKMGEYEKILITDKFPEFVKKYEEMAKQ